VIQTPQGQIGHVALLFIAQPHRRYRLHPFGASPAIPPRVRRHRSFSERPDPVSARRGSGLDFVAQPSNLMFLWSTAANPVCRYPAPAPIDDFVLLFFPPSGPHLTPLAIGSLASGLLVSPLLESPARHGPSRPLFTYTNANQAATCTYNTQSKVSPLHVVNHSSQPGTTIHWFSDAPVLNYHKSRTSRARP
jgi:hypothetical protein